MPLFNKTQRLNIRTRNNLTRSAQNNSTGVKAFRNPINAAIMGYNNYWRGKRQYVNYLTKYGKITEEQGERYLKLISNNNKTLNNATKKSLKPWLLPEAPPGFKPRPPTYPRKTYKNLNSSRNNNSNNNPRQPNNRNASSPKSDPSTLVQ